MSWLRRMFDRSRPKPSTMQAALPPSRELAAAKARQKQLLSRADRAIKDAMDHADEMFTAQPYRGAERRKAPR